MSTENRREYLRANVALSAQCRLLTRQEVDLIAQGEIASVLQGGKNSSPFDEIIDQMPTGSKEEHLYRCLKMMDNKLDFIIEQMISPHVRPGTSIEEVVELSGSGLKFVSKKPLSEGSLLKMDLIMPGTFEFKVEFIAKVVRVYAMDFPRKGGISEYHVAVHFAEIHERARDAIIETIFKRQRKMIRMEKDQKEG